MNAFRAHYFDGLSSRLHEVEVRRLEGGRIRIVGVDVDREEDAAALRLTPRLARTLRTIELADGARVMASHDERLDQWFPNHDRLQRLVDRLERHAQAVAASIMLCLVMAVVTFVWGVPWLSDHIAAKVPKEIEASLGDQVLGQLDRYLGFAASKLDGARQAELGARFDRLVAGLPDASGYRVVFRDAEGVGPNALAVPGGIVVVTDQLVDLLGDDREFDAVVAHEIGHQQHRHALRQTLRSSFVLVIAALFTGDVSSASTVVVAVPTFLLQSHYSRGFEQEADRYAFDTLAAHRISPAWFASAMRRLDAHYDSDGDDDAGVAYLSSHPRSADRIAAAEAAGAAFITAHPELVRETPGYDPCVAEGICPDEDDCDDDACIDSDEADEYEDSEDAVDSGS
ncbi:MAG: M48 family metallopeptidase [Dokdonella sp.]